MTIGESIRRYGRPTLTSETLEDKIFECEERLRYYKLLKTSIENRLIEMDPFSDCYDSLYARLTETIAIMESYATELCLLHLGRN